MEDRAAIHCFVAGKVQGVWFRASTKAQAEQLAITGWARNLPDGRVEVMAYGNKNALAQLHNWLKQGPKGAQVVELTCEEASWVACQGFEIS